MPHKNWLADVKQAVIQVRPFAQQEQQKRLARMQTEQKQAAPKVTLTLADYITAFQIDIPSYYAGSYKGNTRIVTDFLADWQDKVEQLAMHEQPKELARAVEFMTGDLEEIVECFIALEPADEYFDADVKKYCKEVIDKVIVPIRDGWQTAPAIYAELLQLVQDFLGELGVTTLALKVGDQVDYDIVEPVESTQNITTNPEEDETIMAIHLYPYAYGEEPMPFVDGRAIVWRKG